MKRPTKFTGPDPGPFCHGYARQAMNKAVYGAVFDKQEYADGDCDAMCAGLTPIWHERLDLFREAGWWAVQNPHKFEEMKRCPPFGQYSTLKVCYSPCCYHKVCPNCFARRRVRPAYLRLCNTFFPGGPKDRVIKKKLFLLESRYREVIARTPGDGCLRKFVHKYWDHRPKKKPPVWKTEMGLLKSYLGALVYNEVHTTPAHLVYERRTLIVTEGQSWPIPSMPNWKLTEHRQADRQTLCDAVGRAFRYTRELLFGPVQEVVDVLKMTRGHMLMLSYGCLRPSKNQTLIDEDEDEDALR